MISHTLRRAVIPAAVALALMLPPPPAGAATFSWPVSGRKILSPYGPRRSGFHTGTDIKCAQGQPIYAARHGRVVFAGRSGGYGYATTIDHGKGIQTVYAHQSRLLARRGAPVERGQRIGSCGRTGHATGTHIHFEVRVGDATRDPERYLD